MSLKDQAPVEITCPMVDDIIDTIKNLGGGSQDCKKMETIRNANQALREWGNNLYDDKKDLTDEVDRLEIKVSDLEYEIRILKDALKSIAELPYCDGHLSKSIASQTL